MTDSYVPIALLVLAAAATAALLIGLSAVLGRVRRSRTDLTPYECGMPPFESAEKRFSVKFYIVAMLFILFDIEVVFLFPWAVVFKTLSWSGFWSILIFIFVLGAGYVYAWRKGAFQWE